MSCDFALADSPRAECAAWRGPPACADSWRRSSTRTRASAGLARSATSCSPACWSGCSWVGPSIFDVRVAGATGAGWPSHPYCSRRSRSARPAGGARDLRGRPRRWSDRRITHRHGRRIRHLRAWAPLGRSRLRRTGPDGHSHLGPDRRVLRRNGPGDHHTPRAVGRSLLPLVPRTKSWLLPPSHTGPQSPSDGGGCPANPTLRGMQFRLLPPPLIASRPSSTLHSFSSGEPLSQPSRLL